MGAHRMAMNPLNGQLWASERFAIDYVQLDDQGRLFAGGKSKLETYPFFGAIFTRSPTARWSWSSTTNPSRFPADSRPV